MLPRHEPEVRSARAREDAISAWSKNPARRAALASALDKAREAEIELVAATFAHGREITAADLEQAVNLVAAREANFGPYFIPSLRRLIIETAP